MKSQEGIERIERKTYKKRKMLRTHQLANHLTSFMMGLKKRSLSQPSAPAMHLRHKSWEPVACGTERLTKKGLGFFRHITKQASGWREGEAVEAGERLASKRSVRSRSFKPTNATQHAVRHAPQFVCAPPRDHLQSTSSRCVSGPARKNQTTPYRQAWPRWRPQARPRR